VAFVAVINYLLSAMQWVEHTDRVIGNANETVKLSIDMETGMRGYLLTGEAFSRPLRGGQAAHFQQPAQPAGLVADNPQQVDRSSG
jgi:CHASE3 domain sensor protein